MTARTLLIVDDAMIIRARIRDTAEQTGWTVVGEAADGQEAADLYQKTRPDAVTLDLVMPRHDGLEALRRIRAIDPAARVLVVSALEQKEILQESFTAGASDFLIKPFAEAALIQALDKLVPPAARGSAPPSRR